MKAKHFMACCLGLLISTSLFGCATGCYQGGCAQTACSACGRCGDIRSNCQCVDPACRLNDCLDKTECCRAFGNIGADN